MKICRQVLAWVLDHVWGPSIGLLLIKQILQVFESRSPPTHTTCGSYVFLGVLVFAKRNAMDTSCFAGYSITSTSRDR